MIFSPFSYEQQNIVTDGLVLNLDAGNVGSYSGSGTTWYDLSNNLNNGTLVNIPTFTSVNNNSSYFTFNGTNQYSTITPPVINIMTISLWIYIISTPSPFAYIFNKTNYPTNNSNYGMYLNSNNTIHIISYNGSTANDISTSVLTNNTWYNITAIYNGASSAIYVNSVSSYTGTMLSLSSGTVLSIAANYIGSYFYFLNARISNFVLYNRVLKVAEINQNFNVLRGRYGL
jgi:hypothetical protein